MDRQHFGLKGPDSKSRLYPRPPELLSYSTTLWPSCKPASAVPSINIRNVLDTNGLPFLSPLPLQLQPPYFFRPPPKLEKKNSLFEFQSEPGSHSPHSDYTIPDLCRTCMIPARGNCNRGKLQSARERESLRMGLKDALGMSSSLVSDSIQRNRSPLEEFSADIDN